VAVTEANARVTVLERELQELTRRKVRQEMEATAREKSATDALDVAESRVATLEHHRRESSPAVAAKAAEIERLKIELEIASKSKGRLETVEANLKTALAEAKEAAEAAETARDVAVHKGRADVDVLKIRVVSLQEESTSASTKIEKLKTLLDNQVRLSSLSISLVSRWVSLCCLNRPCAYYFELTSSPRRRRGRSIFMHRTTSSKKWRRFSNTKPSSMRIASSG
jgi:chromosome segregation ATPase